MSYSLVIPKEMVSEIYHLREAKLAVSIRAFILTAIQDKIELYADKLKELKETEKNSDKETN